MFTHTGHTLKEAQAMCEFRREIFHTLGSNNGELPYVIDFANGCVRNVQGQDLPFNHVSFSGNAKNIAKGLQLVGSYVHPTPYSPPDRSGF